MATVWYFTVSETGSWHRSYWQNLGLEIFGVMLCPPYRPWGAGRRTARSDAAALVSAACRLLCRSLRVHKTSPPATWCWGLFPLNISEKGNTSEHRLKRSTGNPGQTPRQWTATFCPRQFGYMNFFTGPRALGVPFITRHVLTLPTDRLM